MRNSIQLHSQTNLVIQSIKSDERILPESTYSEMNKGEAALQDASQAIKNSDNDAFEKATERIKKIIAEIKAEAAEIEKDCERLRKENAELRAAQKAEQTGK